MAIMSPNQLPVVLRVDSNPLKLHVMSMLGYPITNVELTEVQLEQVLRSTGDFISRYFPLSEKLAFFNTIPLQAEYPVPSDSYWIRSISWDPATTRIDQVFGAESFLFCYPGGSNILTSHGPMLAEALFEKTNEIKVTTAFRPHKARMRWNTKKQPVTLLKTEKDFLICTPNHPVSCNGEFIMAHQCKIGDKLINHKDKLCEIIDKKQQSTDGTWSIQNKTGSLYVSALGNEFYLAH